MQIYKSKIENIIVVPLLVPDDVDRNWQKITEEEIRKSSAEFIENIKDKKVNIGHRDWTDIDWAKFVGSYIAPIDMKFEKWEIKAWTWIVDIRLPAEIYKNIKKWDFSGVSIEWFWQVN